MSNLNKSLLLLVSFAGLVACPGDKKEEPADQTTTETCPADAPVVVEEKKPEAVAPVAEEKKPEVITETPEHKA
jgi:hypothetical protein